MKTIKKLSQAIIKIVLAISMMFGTGITGVFADEVTPADQGKVDKVKSLINEIKTLDQELKNLDFQNMISEIESRLVNPTSADNDYLGNVASIIEGVKNINDNIYSNKDVYVEAINSLKAHELYYNENLVDYLNGLINPKVKAINPVEALKNLVIQSEDLANLYNAISNNPELVNIYNELFEQYTIVNYTKATEDNYISTVGALLASDIKLNEAVLSANEIAQNNNLTELVINGLKLDLSNLSDKMYVGYQVEILDVVATTSTGYAIVKIIKPEVLVVGSNEVKIIVTSLDGQVKEYIINVIRQDEFADQGDGTDKVVPQTTNEEVKEETKVVALSNIKSLDEEQDVEIEEEKDKDKKEKYDEEIEEKEGLNAVTVILIVGGIALIGFGIYMLFGDNEEELPKAKEIKKTNNNSNKSNKTKKKK